MRLDFAGHELFLHPCGVVLWPKHDALIVADLHLEKGSHFAQRGFFLPPYDSIETLKKLHFLCQENKIKKLIILGDSFHDSKGYTRMENEAKELFHQLLHHEVIWIIGNHDADFLPENIPAYEVCEHDGIVFRHESVPKAVNEISGHFHPKAQMSHGRAVIQRPCFIEDGNKLILPAFGAYTGGLNIIDPAIKSLFKAKARFHALGEQRIYSFPL